MLLRYVPRYATPVEPHKYYVVYNEYCQDYLASATKFIYTPPTRAFGHINHLNRYAMAKKLALKPLGDRVVVRPAEKGGERTLASGLIIPETADKEKLLTGTVVAVGPGKFTESGSRLPMEVAIDDVVLFKKPWDEPFKLDGVEYYVLGESDISLIQLS